MVAQTPLGVDLYHGDVLPSSHLRGRPAAFPAGMRSGRAWLAHKITEGASFRDPAALGRLPVAGQAGMLLAVYHFVTADSVAAQAANFMHAAGQIKQLVTPAKILYVIDNEPTDESGEIAPNAATDKVASDLALAVYQAGVRWWQIWSYGPPSAVI